MIQTTNVKPDYGIQSMFFIIIYPADHKTCEGHLMKSL